MGMKTKLVLLPVGGTISMVSDSQGAGAMPKLAGADLVRPALASDDIEVEIIQRTPIASANLALPDLVAIARDLDQAFQRGAPGAVITLGTDTLEEVAFALDLLTGCRRPIVLTGAMRFANQAGAEGPANLRAAIKVASDPEAKDRGVLVVMNDEIHAARFVAKANTISTAAFTSSPFGPMGIVAEGKPIWAFRPNAVSIKLPAEPKTPQVPIVTMGFGDDDRFLNLLKQEPPDGLVVAALGAGHVPARIAGALEALAATCPVLLASRISSGPTLKHTYGYPGAEMDLLSKGLISAGILSAPKAKVALQILLSAGADLGRIKEVFAILEK
jgi:L-asparaginase